MDFDLIVIGAGPGGYVAAEHAAALGLKTAVVEQGELGGTCLNRGCMPTKALLHAAGRYSELLYADSLGLRVESVGFDFPAMQAYKNGVVEQLRAGVAQAFKARKIVHIAGRAKVLSPTKIEAGGAVYTAKNLLIATGAVPARPPIPGIDLPGVLTSDDLLTPEGRALKSLVIIGGGVIGVEFASVYRALGCSVTIVEAAPRLLPAMDREISQSLAMLFKKRGVEVAAGAQIVGIEPCEAGLAVVYQDKKGADCRAEAEAVLAAVGRRAETAGLFAEGLDPLCERGALAVNERFETSIPGVYAVGDAVAGNIQLAHVASAQGIAVVHRLAGKPAPIGLDCIPACVYTDPEIASAGVTEEQAKAAGTPVLVGKATTGANGKSLVEQQERGFVKLVFRAEDEALIGAQLMCPRATDLIAALVLAIVNGADRSGLLRTMFPHPTFSESIGQAAEAARKK